MSVTHLMPRRPSGTSKSFDILYGIFIRDAQGVTLVGVNSHDNCVGMPCSRMRPDRRGT